MRWLTLLAPAPIVAGPLRGRWWLPAGGGKVWRVLGGTYEREQTELFLACVRPGDVVADLGAHIGYYTLLASRLVGPAGRVFAFEPHPRNAWYLRRHAGMNRCGNVEVIQSAAYDVTGSVQFGRGAGSGTGRITADGGVPVRSVRVDDFLQERCTSASVLKIDVEGAERPVLDGACETLRRDRPFVFLSTHGPDQAEQCRRLLSRLDYRATPLPGPSGERDLFCVAAERESELQVREPPLVAP